jgi:CcmD family protein
MNTVKFLFAAYIATWLIHGFYMGTLVRRFSRLRREINELHKSNPDSHS